MHPAVVYYLFDVICFALVELAVLIRSDGNKSLYLVFVGVVFSQHLGLLLGQHLELLLEQLGQHLELLLEQLGQ
jgi:hypothetical protein